MQAIPKSRYFTELSGMETVTAYQLADFMREDTACRRLLLHCCCAPCSGALVEVLLASGLKPTLYYSNSNIYPAAEYQKRRDECRRFASECGIPFAEDEYCHEAWLRAVEGLQDEPERGRRCTKCFSLRLSTAALYAHENGYGLLATTLSSSRWKNIDDINAEGMAACSLYDDVEWIPGNWRKAGLQQRRGEIIKERGFYNQLWCGCEFSQRTTPSGPLLVQG